VTTTTERAAERPSAPPAGPPVPLSSGPLGAVQAADREISRQTAIRAKAVAEFAAARPATADRAQGEPGAMSAERWAARPEVLRSVSEWAVPELTVALSVGAEAAEKLLERSLILVHRLPGTLGALEAGALHPGHLWPLLEKVAPIEDDTVRAEVEASLLRWAAGRVTTPAQLGAKARREVLRRDARAAARRLEKAIRGRGVHVHPAATDGMAEVTALLTMPEAQLLVQALGAYADEIVDDPGNPRTRGQKMADCLLDLVLRAGETDAPSVQLVLTVVASIGTLAGGDEPGEIDGQVVPAEMVRELLARIGGRPPVAEGRADVSPPTEGTPAPPTSYMSGDGDEAETERWWAEMERQVLAEELGLTPEHPPDDVQPTWTTADADPEAPPERAEPTRTTADADPEAPPERAEPTWATANADPEAPAERSMGAEEGGWWRAADRAAAAAGQALLDTAQAVSRARRLVREASIADLADEAEWSDGPGGRLTNAEDAIGALDRCTEEQRQWLADLLAATGGGGLADRPRIALTDALSGTLLALTDLPGLRRAASCGERRCARRPASCTHDLSGRPGLGSPPRTDGYRPGAALDRWVRARDRRCRFPGCRRRVPRGGELDHARPYPLGATDAGNLVGYCTGHHRGKHQAPGWVHELSADGTLTVTTPTGLTVTTEPPPF
jgi:hypothetical protein